MAKAAKNGGGENLSGGVMAAAAARKGGVIGGAASSGEQRQTNLGIGAQRRRACSGCARRGIWLLCHAVSHARPLSPLRLLRAQRLVSSRKRSAGQQSRGIALARGARWRAWRHRENWHAA
jgi:hypothetical protein